MFLPEDIIDRVLIIPPPPPPCVDDEKDTLAWKYAANCVFDVKSAYLSLTSSNQCNREAIWKRIW